MDQERRRESEASCGSKPEDAEETGEEEQLEDEEESRFSKYFLPTALFVLTVFTTLWAGAYQDHPDRFHPFLGAWTLLTERPGELANGIPFALTLLRRANPLVNATRIAMPVAADTKFCTVRPSICVK